MRIGAAVPTLMFALALPIASVEAAQSCEARSADGTWLLVINAAKAPIYCEVRIAKGWIDRQSCQADSLTAPQISIEGPLFPQEGSCRASGSLSIEDPPGSGVKTLFNVDGLFAGEQRPARVDRLLGRLVLADGEKRGTFFAFQGLRTD
ncbi:hypothetical protein RUR49_02960 [Pseudoxanthobacter sp. M-2]|uniref:hypothetical protein n=1 Tax=Pseudoxanthobacter sp. M-2 TaxID=3078754 RepID=UPI0038FC274D